MVNSSLNKAGHFLGVVGFGGIAGGVPLNSYDKIPSYQEMLWNYHGLGFEAHLDYFSLAV